MRLSWASVAVGASCFVSNVFAYAPTDSIMDGDSEQSGYLPNHNMDPNVITGGSFGQIWSHQTVGGASEQFYAKPLVFTPASTGRQVVLSFSEQNRIYSLDAVNGTLYASRDLGLEGETPFMVSDLGQCNDISGTIGITGTPVIDPDTETIYFWAKSYIGSATGYTNGAYRFHAINAVTLAELPGFPVNIQSTPADNDNTRWFTGGTVLQRTSLNLVNGVVFAGFGGHCDQYNYTGWLVGMSASEPKLITAYTTNGGPGAPAQDGTWNGGGGQAGIWMGGSAIASDNSGRVFFVTANGWRGSVNQNLPASGRVRLDTLSECVVNMAVNATTGVVSQSDYFEPYTYTAMDAGDRDLGAGGVILPDPSVFSGGGIERLAITVGKNGIAYIMNADNLGGYKLGAGGTDGIIQTIPMPGGGAVFANSGTYPLEGGFLYITPVGYPTLVYSLGFTNTGVPAFTLVSQTPDTSAGRVGTGPATVTTNKGQAGTGILWIVDPDAGLRAYNAVPVDGNMTKINLPATPAVSGFQRPAFGDGRYYISTSDGQILAYGSPVNMPMTCSSPTDFGSVPIGDSSTLNVTCTTNIAITKITGLVLGKILFTASNSSLPTGPLKAGATFSFPVTFDLTNHVLNAGSTSSPQVVPGVQTTSLQLLTVNGVAGYATSQPITLTGMSISSAPFITMNPLQVDFDGIVVGSEAAEGGSSNTFIINNVGLAPMDITGFGWTNESVTTVGAVFHNLTQNVNGSTVFDANGYFTSTNMPLVGTIIPGGGSVTVDVNFDADVTGSYFTALMVYSNGGNAYTLFTGSASTAPIALLEYSDGEGGWTTIPDCPDPTVECSAQIEFAPSSGLTQQTITLRMSNIGGSALTITKSKPLEGTVLGATAPLTDFSEGLSIVPGTSTTASVLFSPGQSVLNAASIYYSGAWTLNTDDLTFGVHAVNFTGELTSTQVGPKTSSGSALYQYLGCYLDYTNGVRIETQESVSVNMTNGLCQTTSQSQGAVFAGTEYMTQCFYGSVIPNISLLVADSYCSYSCGGDSTEVCGGQGGYLSVYYDSSRYFPSNGTIIGASGLGPQIPKVVGAYDYYGCWSDSQTARVLTSKATAGSSMTLESCATFCSAYTYFGTEYADECYCGNALGSTSVLELDSSCNMPCANNTGEYCGAGSRLSVYIKNGTVVSSASSSSATSSKTSTGSSTSATATATGSFTSLGCYTDNIVTARTLTGAATAGSAIDVESCAAYCSGYTYFGVEYGDECYCGNSIVSTGVPAIDGRCSMPCAANSAEICGGSYGLNLYSLSPSSSSSSTTGTTVTKTSSSFVQVSTTSSTTLQTSTSTSASSTSSTPTPSIPATVGAYTYLHCHSDNTTIRTLQGKYLGKPDMTIEHCAGNCTGYAYFGVEYMQECYCGNTLTFGSYIATDGRCDMLCGGNPGEICGGASGLTLYQNLTGVVSSSSVGSTSTTSSVSSTSASVSVSTSSSVSSSSSSVSISVSSSSSSVSTSSSSSVEVSSTSSTSSSVGLTATSTSSSSVASSSSSASVSSSVSTSSSSSVQTSSSQSSTSSSVSSTSTSSSVSSVSSTSSSTQSSSSSSQTPSSTSSSSSVLSTTSTTSSSVSSSSSSVSSAFTSSSSSIQSTSSSQTTTSTSSSVLPTSTSSSASLSTSSLISTTSTSSISTISSSASSSATAAATPSPWTYLGCASDNVLTRALTGSSTTNTTAMTVEYCQAYCTSKNFGVAGIEYSSECYCGYSLTNNSTLGQTGCSMTCAGNKSEICGGSKLLSVYNNTNFVPPSIPQSVGGYNYTGCYTELTNARAIDSYSVTSTTAMTVEMCVGACSAKGYAIAAIEYGSQCFCGNSISTSSSVVADSQCEVMLCPGNAKEWCSAGSRLQVYTS